MPGMPFHLEKGHALMALEDLLNNPANHATLAAAYDGLRQGTPVAQVFAAALVAPLPAKPAPVLDQYAGKAGAGGLGQFVGRSWFGDGGNPYWLDYEGDVDGIIREALLFAIEKAWGVDRAEPLPAELDHSRRIDLLWHCAQRWFDAWVTWQAKEGPVVVLFATPPHVGGSIVDRIDVAVAAGWAKKVDAAGADPDGDMVLVCQETNLPGPKLLAPFLDWSGLGEILLPAIGRDTVGGGDPAAYSISADAGGATPRTAWA
jgi:hypothetical protein